MSACPPDIECCSSHLSDALLRAEVDRITSIRVAGDLARAFAEGKRFAAACVRDSSASSYYAQCAISQLGRTLRDMGGARLRQAERLHWSVLETRLRVEGRGSHLTINSSRILADTLDMRKKHRLAAAVRAWGESIARHTEDRDPMTERIESRLRRLGSFREIAIQRRVDSLIDGYVAGGRSGASIPAA